MSQPNAPMGFFVTLAAPSAVTLSLFEAKSRFDLRMWLNKLLGR